MLPKDLAKPKQVESANTQSLNPHAHQLGVYRPAPVVTPTPPPTLSHATVQRSLANPRALAPNDILHLQRTIGNQAVLRMLNAQANPVIQRDTQAGFEAGKEFESQLSRSKGAGAPLPKKTREGFESSFGANFSNVRIHTDSAANQLSRSIQAKAFTHGNDIHFGAGEFNSTSSQGKKLLAHELTHTIQQTGGKQTKGVQPKLQVGAANDRYEHQANRVATQVSQSRHQTQPQRLPHPQPMTTSIPAQGSPPARIQRAWGKEKISFNEQTESVKKNSKSGRKKAITKMAMTGKTTVDQGKQLEAVIIIGASGAHLSAIINDVVPNPAGFVRAERTSVLASITTGKRAKKGASTSIQNEAKATTDSIVENSRSTRRNLLYVGGSESLGDYEMMLERLKEKGYHTTFVMSHTAPGDVSQTFLHLVKLEGRVDLGGYTYKKLEFVDDAFLFNSPVAERPQLIWQKGKGIGHQITDKHETYIKNSLGAINKNQGKSPTQAPTKLRQLDGKFLQAGGAELWEEQIGRNASPKLSQITTTLRTFNGYKAKNRGNAMAQGQLLLGLQKKLTNLGTLKQNTQNSATSELTNEVKSELEFNPIQLQNVSDEEKIKELVKVGFTEEFFAKNIKSSLYLLYEAHAALSHNRLDLAQNAFDRLNPVVRQEDGKFKTTPHTYLERGHNALYYAQNALIAHHHESIGGTVALSHMPTDMNPQELKSVRKVLEDKKLFVGSGVDESKPRRAKANKLKETYGNLKSEELEAIHIYTSEFYSKMNATLQDARLTNSDEHENHKNISSLNQLVQSGLSKLPKYQGGMLYRMDTDQGGLLNFAKVGTTYRTPLFMSTSKRPESMPFANPIGWCIKAAANSRAKDVTQISAKGVGEEEVLIPVGTKMNIIDIYRRDFSQKVDDNPQESDDARAARLYHSDKGNKHPAGDVLRMLKDCWSSIYRQKGDAVLVAQEL